MSDETLRVAIDARVVPGEGTGGVESVLFGLVRALGRLDGPETYRLIVTEQAPDWLGAVVGPSQQVVVEPRPPRLPRFHPNRVGRSALRRTRALLQYDTPAPQVPLSDGFIESLGCALVHFPTQRFVICSLPSVYNPHDLQHRHLPEFFTPQSIAWREVTYRTGCALARTVVVASDWVKRDVVRELGAPSDRVQVIPWAAPADAVAAPPAGACDEILRKHGLTEPFALYPAVLWPHKNHARLLDAVALLRARHGIALRLICTGHREDSTWPALGAQRRALGLEQQVSFPGVVPTEELRALYARAQFVVVPTLFEAASAPVFEAWSASTPVACSTVTSLPEQVRDAALLFDPRSIDAIVSALHRMSTDAALRATLVERGRVRARDFDWTRTAQAYRAVYRKVAGRTLTSEDQELLAWDWMRQSRPQDAP